MSLLKKKNSPFLAVSGENSINSSPIFNLSPRNFYSSPKLERGGNTVCAELDDTEFIDSEFVCRITERNANITKDSHEMDNSLGSKLQQPHKEGDNVPLNFSNNSKFSAFDILEVENKFYKDERTSQANKEINSTGENLTENYNTVRNRELKDRPCMHRMIHSTIRANTSMGSPFSKSPKPIFQSTVLNDKDIINKINSNKDDINLQNINLNCSTPVSNNLDSANLSNNDMFSDSPLTNCSSIRQETDCIKNQTLEEFDINWGGESLLEFSQIETKIFETNPKQNVLKRKLSDLAEEFNYSKKKICLLPEKEKFNYSKKSYLPEAKEKSITKGTVTKSYFHDSMPFDSQIENLISENEKCSKPSSSHNNFERSRSEVSFKLISPKIDYLKLKNRPMSEGNISSKTVTETKDKNLREMLISNTFNATFKHKLSEMFSDSINEEFKINDVNSDKDDFDKLDLCISDSEDFITESPELEKKHKKDFSLKIGSSNALGQFSSPIKTTPKSSPAKHDSPAKYPPIGGDIIKITKSPVSKKSTMKKNSTSPSKKHENKNARCLMSEFVKKCEDIAAFIKVDESVTNAEEIVANILESKEVSFIIETKDISEFEIHKNKIGNKILKSINNQERIEYKCCSGDVAIVQISFYNGKTVYNLDMTHGGEKMNSILREIFSNRNLKLCGIDTKKNFRILFNCCNIIVECEIFDVGVAEWLLDPGEKYKSLKELAKELLGKSNPIDSEVDDKHRQELILLKELQVELTKRLKKRDLEKLFFEIEIPIQRCLLSMELTGIGFNQNVVNTLWSQSTELMGTLEIAAYTLAKQKFSLNSNVELSWIKRKLKILPDQESKNPFIEIVRNWRKLHSLKTKNLSQLLLERKMRCYCFSSTKTVTGRIVLYDPDLQHIPRDFTINEKLFSLRSAFIAMPGNVLVSADYGQLELRILAHFSQDPFLIPLLRQSEDVFKMIAAEWGNVSKEMVTEDMRHEAKQLCYGIIYGMSDKTLGEAIGKTAADSSLISAFFKRRFPKLNDFVNNTISECRQVGKIITLGGRVRHLPEINSNIAQCRARAERQAVNSKIQGSAADITKKAMVNIEERLNFKFPDRKFLPTAEHSSHLILQLHDELIYEVSETIKDTFVGILKDEMEMAVPLSVPLPVVVKCGTKWGNLEKI